MSKAYTGLMTLTYEQCKALKDAGYEQFSFDTLKKRRGYYVLDGDERMREVYLESDLKERGLSELIYVPTLSELIEACGDRFGRLDHVQMKGVESIWVAYSSRIENEINVPAYIFQQGATPIEAVANLFLALIGYINLYEYNPHSFRKYVQSSNGRAGEYRNTLENGTYSAYASNQWFRRRKTE